MKVISLSEIKKIEGEIKKCGFFKVYNYFFIIRILVIFKINIGLNSSFKEHYLLYIAVLLEDKKNCSKPSTDPKNKSNTLEPQLTIHNLSKITTTYSKVVRTPA